MLTKHRAPASHKQSSPAYNGHSASIRKDADSGVKIRGRGRPEGALSAEFAAVEKEVEGLCVAIDCSCCIGKWAHVYGVTRELLQKNEAHLERHEISIETFARNFKKLMEMQRLAGVEMHRRKHRLDTVEIPEIRNLASQAERKVRAA